MTQAYKQSRFIVTALTICASALLSTIGTPPSGVRGAQAAKIVIVPGTVDVDPPLQETIRAALSRAGSSIPPSAYYTVTDVRQQDHWFFVSLAGLVKVDAAQHWTMDDANWIGLVVANQATDGTWVSAVEGTTDFTALLAQMPGTVLSPAARAGLDPAQRARMPTEAFRFPWATGTRMQYGVLGVHNGDFVSVVGDYKAVDLLSDGNTALGHAPNQLLAAASGTVSYVCRGSLNVAIRIGNMLYVHLLNNSKLVVGHTFNQGDELGQLKTGTFSDNCGHANQGNTWFHVHWAFPNTGSFQAGGWTLNFADQLWHRGNETVSIYGWLLAESPTRWHVEYFSDTTMTSRCYEGYEDSSYVFKQWDMGAPAAGCPADSFGARFTRQVNFQGGSYAFHVEHDDGARLYIDDQLVLDPWSDGSGGHDATRVLTGTHEVNVQYYDASGVATLGAWWVGPGALPNAPPADPGAWRAEYFGNRDLWGSPALVLNEATTALQHAWGDGGPGSGLPGDDFSARYTRSVDFTCGRYRFSLHADDGARLWVGNQLLLDEWREQDATFTADIDLDGGSVPVKVEFFERGWGATLALNWSRISTAPCVETKPDLRPYTPAGDPYPVVPSPNPGTHVTGTLYAGRPAYVDWHFTNDGYASTSAGFDVELWIDGVRQVRNTYWGLESGLVAGVDDWSTVVVTAGWHLVKLVIDPANAISELDETNNTWQSQFYWTAAGWQGQAADPYRIFLPHIIVSR